MPSNENSLFVLEKVCLGPFWVAKTMTFFLSSRFCVFYGPGHGHFFLWFLKSNAFFCWWIFLVFSWTDFLKGCTRGCTMISWVFPMNNFKMFLISLKKKTRLFFIYIGVFYSVGSCGMLFFWEQERKPSVFLGSQSVPQNAGEVEYVSEGPEFDDEYAPEDLEDLSIASVSQGFFLVYLCIRIFVWACFGTGGSSSSSSSSSSFFFSFHSKSRLFSV